MTCEQCQELISAFLDRDLDETNSGNVRTHLAVCEKCAKICADFAAILDFCQVEDIEDSMPPNPKALWCRINNLIETEVIPEKAEEKIAAEAQAGWFSRFWNNSWQFSFSQVLAAFIGIALVSSLLTIVGIQNYSKRRDAAAANSVAVQPNFFDKILSKIGLIETPQQARERRVKEQQIAIDYWRKRVEERRSQWDAHLREAFDRNLNEINQVVYEYDRILQEDPQDEISSEMLDSALNEQMELLREFSEL
jgi:hypothetical protein